MKCILFFNISRFPVRDLSYMCNFWMLWTSSSVGQTWLGVCYALTAQSMHGAGRAHNSNSIRKSCTKTIYIPPTCHRPQIRPTPGCSLPETRMGASLNSSCPILLFNPSICRILLAFSSLSEIPKERYFTILSRYLTELLAQWMTRYVLSCHIPILVI